MSIIWGILVSETCFQEIDELHSLTQDIYTDVVDAKYVMSITKVYVSIEKLLKVSAISIMWIPSA